MDQEIDLRNTVCIKLQGAGLLAAIIIPKSTIEPAQGLIDIFNSLRQQPGVPEYLVGMTGFALSWGLNQLGARIIPVSLN